MRFRDGMFVPSSVCFADAGGQGQGDGAGGGGGSGSGQGGGAGEGTGDLFSDAQRDWIIRTVNGANSAHHSRISKTLEQRFGEFGEQFKSGLHDTVAELLKQGGGKGGDKGKGDKGAGAGAGDDVAAQVRAEYEARLSEVEKRSAERERKFEEERQRNQRNEERTRIEQSLRAAGVSEGLVRSAVALLHTEDRRVVRDDNGNIVFAAPREGYTDHLDLDKGIEEWLKSPEGKHFAPARPVGGSGAQGGRPGQPGTKPPTHTELNRHLLEAIRNRLAGGR